ncbi:MAG: nucleotidyltransferase domain-containing protein [Parcubacteria group bacterium]|nr:nucleotidyltransferase domain-containing protein [Parcubacteria group bacterium]
MRQNLIILFGSHATGRTRAGSDVDVAVLSKKPLSLKEKGLVSEESAKQLGVSEDSIDIIDLSVADPLLQHEVAENGKLLSGDKDDFDLFRLLAWKRYQGTAKFRRARERALGVA